MGFVAVSLSNVGVAMDMGVWMSREVLAHKRDGEHRTEAWNLRCAPPGLSEFHGAHRLFVAVEGHWRGFFRLLPGVMRNDQDPACPYTLVFDPRSWTGMLPERAPPYRHGQAFTRDVPKLMKPDIDSTREENETEGEVLSSLLEREEERE